MSDFAYRTITLKVPPNKSIDLEFENLSYKVNLGFRKGSKILLNGVSGKFQSGHLTGIMGPSGAGKSTLLNILSGLISENKNITGVIKYNGIESITRYDKQTCYILQDDQLNPFFTVCETMKIASDLKLGYILSSKAKDFLIEDILDMLGLCSCKDTKCENLSGGQRKRLSIALELIDNPPVMFLDEPTTGLDSLSSLQCIKLLKKLAEGGRNIICTIHQPSASIFELFDQIYALANGECIYQGYSTNTVSYLATAGLQCPTYYNPADFLLDVASGEYGDYVPLLSNQNKTKAFDIKTSPKKMIDNNNCELNKSLVLITKPSEITKFYVILKRMSVQIYRDWTIIHLKVILHFLIAIILGLLFQKCGNDGSKTLSNMGFLAGSVAYLSYTSLMPAVLKFPSELDILRKESFNNWYKLKTFYIAYLIANLPIQILCTIVYSSVSYFLTSQIMDMQRFSMFLSTSILLSLNAESHGLLFGSIVNPINGTFLGAITAATMMLFCGYFVFLNHMPSILYYLTFLSYMKYAMESLSITIYGFHRDILDCPEDAFYCHYRIPSMILNEIGFNQNNYWFNFSILIIQFCFLRLVTFFCLKRKIAQF